MKMDSVPMTEITSLPNQLVVNRLANRLFCLLTTLHVFAWTIIPACLRYNLPMDSLEGSVWGQQLQLGYDKNPWLNAWLTRLALSISDGSSWPVYLFSQLCVALAFWSVWRLGRKFLSPLHALLAVGMLEAIQYYTFASIDFNDNVLELGLWALLILLFYRAVTLKKLADWLGVGIVAGLAMMAKYYTAILLLTLFLFLIIDKDARQAFKEKGLYIALVSFLIIILPHVIWLFTHDFVPIRYAAERVGDNTPLTTWQYIKPTLLFASAQLSAFVGAVVLLSFSMLGRVKTTVLTTKHTLSSFDRRFLWLTGTGVFFITLALAFTTGWQLHTLWGVPLLSFWGLLLVSYLQPRLTKRRLIYFSTAVMVVFMSCLTVYSVAMLKPGNTSSGNFPGKAVSTYVTKLWQARYHTPLHYVAGDRYIAGYISFNAKPKPSVYLDYNPEKSPWINEIRLRKEGAVFVQPITTGREFSKAILQRFPHLQILPIQYFAYHRSENAKQVKMAGVLIGILPAH
jgi:4-amino-4-deoxy-L-arabinose transferase-like glycosyltransferase